MAFISSLRWIAATPSASRHSSGIKDIIVEVTLTAILDMNDSVSAVGEEVDKAKIYSNIFGVLRGHV